MKRGIEQVRVVVAALVLAVLACLHSTALAEVRLDKLVIIVPGAAGGGFDTSAQALARALKAEGLVGDVEIRRSPGAGGLVALAQFEAAVAPSVPTIFIGGSTVVGAAAQNRSVVTLSDVAPISQLNQISLMIAVRSDSPVKTMRDLVELMRTQESRFEWVGGSPGSADELLLLALARKLDLPRERYSYIAIPGGGARVAERLLQGHHLAAVSSYEEFVASPAKDKLRMLAVSGERRIRGVDVPTMRETGLDLVISDWKGVFASRKSSPKELQLITEVMNRVLASPSWANEIRSHGWNAPSASPAGFPAFIVKEEAQVEQLIAYNGGNRQPDSYYRNLLERPWRFGLIALIVAGLLGTVVIWQRIASQRRERELLEAKMALETIRDQLGSSSSKERSAITQQLQDWGLSTAEIEIAWMILKGLQFKEIAGARGTSERTVRQQAQGIYAKSGLGSRTEFSAFFLEDLRF